MDFKQDAITDIIESESQMVLHGLERYGQYFVNASNFNDLLQQFIKSVDSSRYVFAMFLSQIRKHYLLAYFSTLRLQHTQAMMNLRQMLEAGSCAAYAIANPDQFGFANFDRNGIMNPSRNLTRKRNKWLKENFKDGSDTIENMKGIINNSAAHSNIVAAHRNFKFDGEQGKFVTPFFDFEDDYHLKTSLWQIGNAAMALMGLLYNVNRDLGVIEFVDDFLPRVKSLESENSRLRVELMSTQRFKTSHNRSSG
jgi:hypothetical protein